MLNKIVIMGRMVRDPELRVTGNSTSVVNFTLAVEQDVADNRRVCLQVLHQGADGSCGRAAANPQLDRQGRAEAPQC